MRFGPAASQRASTWRSTRELSVRDDIKQRFLREGYAGNSVKHPSVVMVVDDDTSEDGSAFIVMERLLRAAHEKDLRDRRLRSNRPLRVALQRSSWALRALRGVLEWARPLGWW